MAKIRFLNFYRAFNNEVPSVGNTTFGNFLGFPGVALVDTLLKHDIHLTLGDDFDIIVFYDLDEELFTYAKKLPSSVKKILIIVENSISCPLPHHPYVLIDPVWNAVIAYNRDIAAPKISYYDIAVTGIQCPIPSLTPLEASSTKGVFIGTHKTRAQGYYGYRNTLISNLAMKDEIVIYGGGWPNIQNSLGKTDNKLQTISDYRFSVVVENQKFNGYVTEKLPDSILAERPALYFGDYETAHRRFGNTFVPLPELTYEAFLEAKYTLFEDYNFYYKNCLEEKKKSKKWIESFIDTTLSAILTC